MKLILKIKIKLKVKVKSEGKSNIINSEPFNLMQTQNLWSRIKDFFKNNWDKLLIGSVGVAVDAITVYYFQGIQTFVINSYDFFKQK